MQQRHINRELYFIEQAQLTTKYVLPYVMHNVDIKKDSLVLEIGCGEAGNLLPFLKMGCTVFGIDKSLLKIKDASVFLLKHSASKNYTLINDDIFNLSIKEISKPFDFIFFRDTIEHIHNQEAFFKHLQTLIKPNGKIFIAYHPWRMPFGGHQQVCKSKFLDKLPYFHLLPKFLYKGVLKLFGESNEKIEDLMDVRETRFSLQDFKKEVKKNNLIIHKETYYLINPNYEIKFKLKPRVMPVWMNIPYLRDFYTTMYYCVFSYGE